MASSNGLGELGALGAVAGVTSSIAVGATAPFTWSWASCSFSAALRLSSALTWAADAGFDWSDLTWAAVEAICRLSCVSAAARLLMVTDRW